MSKLRVGIISANWGAVAHLPAWRALPDVEVVGICTSRQETAEAAAEKFGIERPFWDAEAMAADPDIDIVDCGTRPNIRHSMVKAIRGEGSATPDFGQGWDVERVLEAAHLSSVERRWVRLEEIR